MKGIKRSTAVSTKTRLPVTPQMLQDMKKVWQRRELSTTASYSGQLHAYAFLVF